MIEHPSIKEGGECNTLIYDAVMCNTYYVTNCSIEFCFCIHVCMIPGTATQVVYLHLCLPGYLYR